ncbi:MULTISPECIES: hypothetical protein [Staphylococcaceae]|nr:hypothetical protein [Mammaliicoccus fleurettii]
MNFVKLVKYKGLVKPAIVYLVFNLNFAVLDFLLIGSEIKARDSPK